MPGPDTPTSRGHMLTPPAPEMESLLTMPLSQGGLTRVGMKEP